MVGRRVSCPVLLNLGGSCSCRGDLTCGGSVAVADVRISPASAEYFSHVVRLLLLRCDDEVVESCERLTSAKRVEKVLLLLVERINISSVVSPYGMTLPVE
jgi:hypothetical protein